MTEAVKRWVEESPEGETLDQTRVLNELLSDPFAHQLDALAIAKAEQYQANTPYPHI